MTAKIPQRYLDYLDFFKKYKNNLGYKGDYTRGEIEMVTDINLFEKCEKGAAHRMVTSGTPTKDAKIRAQIGIFDENRWGVSIHEPLRLPDGSYTTFNRWISWGSLESGFAGIVIAPFLTDQRMIFLKNFRNATKSWCLEFPRGGKDLGTSLIKTIKNELSEEIGAEIKGEPVSIGEIFPDSSVLSSRVVVYKAVISLSHTPSYEATEAIRGMVFLKKGELNKIITDQKFIDTDGQEYEFKDGYTLSTLTLLSNQ